MEFMLRSIVRRFSSIILPLIMISLMAFALVIGGFNYKMSLDGLELKSQNTIDLVAMSLQKPVWSYDIEAAEDITLAVMQDPEVIAIQVLVSEDDPPISVRKRENLAETPFADMRGQDNYLYLAEDITQEGETIGMVHIVVSKFKVIQFIQQTSSIIAIFTVGLMVLIGGMIWLASLRIIRKPIDALKEHSKQLAEGNLNVSIDTDRKDELGSLASSFSHMRDSIRKKITDLSVLNSTGEVIAALRDEDEVLHTCLEVMQEHTGVQRGSIYLLNDKGELELRVCFPQEKDATSPKVFKKGEGITGQAVTRKEIIYVPDTSKEPQYIDDEGKHPRTLICIPMIDNQTVLGVMNFSGEIKKTHFAMEDYEFASTISRMVVTITKNIHMFNIIEENNRTLELKVVERTAAIKDLMDNTGQGFFAFGANYEVYDGYSKACESFFGQSIKNTNALELLFPKNQDAPKELLDMIFAGSGDLELFVEMLPQEVAVGKNFLKVEYRWIPTIDDQGKDKIMIILTDITLEKELEAQMKADEERNEMIIKVANDRHGFLLFLREIRELFQLTFKALKVSPENIDAHELFRYYHTIKGGAATYALRKVAHQAHEIESALEEVRSGRSEATQTLMDQINKDTRDLQAFLDIALVELDGLVSKVDLQASSVRMYQVPEPKIAQVKELFLAQQEDNRVKKLGQAIDALSKQPINPVLKKYSNAATDLAEKLGKVIDVKIKGYDIEIDHDRYEHLFGTLIHLVRNSVDHGIETPDVRMEQGKREKGVLKIEATKDEKQLNLIFSDDGGGIDATRIKQIALQKKIIDGQEADRLNDEKAIQLIFAPGFSSKETVSETSGRGVGLDAVKSALDQLSGEIHISTHLGQGSHFEITVPLET